MFSNFFREGTPESMARLGFFLITITVCICVLFTVIISGIGMLKENQLILDYLVKVGLVTSPLLAIITSLKLLQKDKE